MSRAIRGGPRSARSGYPLQILGEKKTFGLFIACGFSASIPAPKTFAIARVAP